MWNFLQLIEIGAASGGLYPVPSSEGLGFETTSDDLNAIVVQIAGVKVIRAHDGGWEPSLNVLRTKGRLFVSDQRVLVTFDKFVPKDQSSFQPIALVRPDGSTSRRPKQMLIGHLAMTQIRQVGLRNAQPGKPSREAINEGLGSLIIAATDATAVGPGGPTAMGTVVAIEVIVAAGVDANALANEVLTRVMRAKAASTGFEVDDSVRAGWAEMTRTGFTAAPGEVQTYDVDPSEPVRSAVSPPSDPPNDRGDPANTYLIPPTDTSPVPTMHPTPAFPMPQTAPIVHDVHDVHDVPHVRNDEPEPLPGTVAMPPLSTLPPPQPVGPAATGSGSGSSSVVLPAPPPPGSEAEWRPDPFARFELRYWDGFGWTEHVHGNGQQTTDPPR